MFCYKVQGVVDCHSKDLTKDSFSCGDDSFENVDIQSATKWTLTYTCPPEKVSWVVSPQVAQATDRHIRECIGNFTIVLKCTELQ